MPYNFLRSTLVVSLFIIGCSSWNKKNASVAFTDPENAWLAQYLDAKKNNDCAGFQKLAEDKKFPMHKIAALRAQEICSLEDWQASWTKFSSEVELEPWMNTLADDIQLRKSEENRSWDMWKSVSSKIIGQQNNLNSKIALIQKTQKKSREYGLNDYTQELQRKLELASPKYMSHPSTVDLIRVADDYRRSRQFKRAREIYQKLIQSKDATFEMKTAAYDGIRKSYKTQRQHEKNLATLLKLLNFYKAAKPDNKTQILDITLSVVRAEWTLGRPEKALARLDKAIAAGVKNKVALAEAYWLKGKIFEERGDWDKAFESYQLAQAQKLTSDLADQVRWSSAWSSLKQKKFDLAAATLQELAEQTKSQAIKTRAYFWLGKTLHNLQKDNEAVVFYEKIIQEDPFNFYSLLASHEMNREVQYNRVRTVAQSPSATTCDWLEKTQEMDLIPGYVHGESSRLAAAQSEDVGEWSSLLRCAGRTGSYSLAFEKFNGLSQGLKNKIINQYPELLFPSPWKDVVLEAAAKYKVEPELIYAIMRQESSFNPKARSPMDAFGLLQVLPEVANIMAKKHQGQALGSFEELYKPETNIPIGAQLLKQLSSKHKDQLLMTIACYNADENAVMGWIKTRYQDDVPEFIEDIPYEETRSYIKLVMRNYIFYKLFLSEKNSVAFPTHFLQLSDKIVAKATTPSASASADSPATETPQGVTMPAPSSTSTAN